METRKESRDDGKREKVWMAFLSTRLRDKAGCYRKRQMSYHQAV